MKLSKSVYGFEAKSNLLSWLNYMDTYEVRKMTYEWVLVGVTARDSQSLNLARDDILNGKLWNFIARVCLEPLKQVLLLDTIQKIVW